MNRSRSSKWRGRSRRGIDRKRGEKRRHLLRMDRNRCCNRKGGGISRKGGKKRGSRGPMHLQMYLVSMNAFNNKRKAETYRDRISMLRMGRKRRGHRVRTRSKRRNCSKRRNRKRTQEMRGHLGERL